MKDMTLDKRTGAARPIKCVRNDTLSKIDIKNKGFLLVILTEGKAVFLSNGEEFSCEAPSFVCFDERDEPNLVSSCGMSNYTVRFHPTFLNVNMTFDRIRSDTYEKVAYEYDLFYCRPFLAHERNIPIPPIYIEKIISSCRDMKYELDTQRDSYWSCRGRSCFIEILVLLERSYSRILTASGKNEYDTSVEIARECIESNYSKRITLADIISFSGSNKTTLSESFKKKYGMTVFEYLTSFRIEIAKKQIEFTNVPIKDIAYRCGFKNVQHFTRVFKRETGETPAAFRVRTLKRRKVELK